MTEYALGDAPRQGTPNPTQAPVSHYDQTRSQFVGEVHDLIRHRPHPEVGLNAGIGRGTLLTLRSTPLDASDAELVAFREAMSSMEEGWGQTLESLAGFVSTAR